MNTKVVNLKEEGYAVEGGELNCIGIGYPFDIAKEWKRPAVIVVPGGAYYMVSKREGEPVAAAFLARGFQTFVLTYLCGIDGVAYPEELCELGAAVDYVKKHADEFNVNADEVFVVGFSAGGHLTANLAVDYASLSDKLGQKVDARPAAVGLSYPVIAAKYGHVDSHHWLMQGYSDEAKAELMKSLELDEQVTDKTAPSFLWTTTKDSCVPVRNTLAFADALARNKVLFELHVYPEGEHGSSVSDAEVNDPAPFLRKNARWVDDCADFFRMYTVEKF